MHRAFTLAGARTAVRCSSTSPWTPSSTARTVARPGPLPAAPAPSPTPTRCATIARPARARPSGPCWCSAATCGPTAPRRPPSAWWRTAGLPALTNGMGRGVIPGGHPLLVTKARSAALGTADLVVVVGTPLDFRLAYGVFGGKDGAPPARVVHLADSEDQVSGHAELAASAYGDLTAGPRRAPRGPGRSSRAGPTGPLGRALQDTVRRPPSGTARCSAPRPTRSTRRGSTASCCRGWPTTRS